PSLPRCPAPRPAPPPPTRRSSDLHVRARLQLERHCLLRRGEHVDHAARAPLETLAILVRDTQQLTDDQRQDRQRERPDEIGGRRSEEHTSELQSRENLVCRLLLEK